MDLGTEDLFKLRLYDYLKENADQSTGDTDIFNQWGNYEASKVIWLHAGDPEKNVEGQAEERHSRDSFGKAVMAFGVQV